jgi:asparagine synthase (glutamine-hydrolysing)
MPDRMNTYNLLMHIGATNVLEPAFIACIDLEEPRAQQADVYAEVAHASLLNRMLAYDWKFTLADNDLPKVVETTRLVGVAARFPLLADELVDFSLGLSPRLKLNGMRLRYFFKEALRGFLPDEILAKKKHGFGLPFGPWVVQDKRLHEFATESIGHLKDRGIVRHDFLRTLLDARIRDHPGYYGEMIWILMTLSEWLRARSTAPAPATTPLVG